VEVTSLYREPERQEEVSFGALELHDVFMIYRSGPAETVALRGLDLRAAGSDSESVQAPGPGRTRPVKANLFGFRVASTARP
jgi:hypothetical protein